MSQATELVFLVEDDPIKIGTLNNILRSVAEHFNLSRDELLKRLFE